MITPLPSPYSTVFAGGVNPWGKPSTDQAELTKDAVCAWLARHGPAPTREIAQGLDATVSRVYTRLRPMLITEEVLSEKVRDSSNGQNIWFYRLRDKINSQ